MRFTSVLYVSCLCSKRIESKVLETKPRGIALSIQKFHRLFASGFAANGITVDTLSFLKTIKQLPSGELYDETEAGIHYNYLIPNKSGISGYLKLLRMSFSKTREYLESTDDSFVICDVLNSTISLGAVLAARRCRKTAVGVITDNPLFMSDGRRTASSFVSWMTIKLCTSYVVMTEMMYEDYLSSRKKYVVIEGIVDSSIVSSEKDEKERCEKKRVLYAGGLYIKYGIEKLVKAFLKADIPNSELHVFGSGDYEDELNSIKDNRVVFHGIVDNATIVSEEKKATLLVNPRPAEGEYTKYSFPSKNMEYMASGTPLLTTDLPGMPRDYLDYVYIFKGEKVDEMSDTLKTVMSIDVEELNEKGRFAQRYVLGNKNNIAQAERVLKLIES